MPLIFVHGVSNRDTPEYQENHLARDAFLRTLVIPKFGLDAHKVQILSPYWGDNGVKFRWDNASLPETFGAMETFGTGLNPKDLHIGADILATSGMDAADIVTVAKHSLVDAIDIVWSAALPAVETAKSSEVLAKSYQKAFDYAEANSKPNWLANANNENFLDLLFYHIKTYEEAVAPPTTDEVVRWEHFGGSPALLADLKDGLRRVMSLAPSAISSVATSLGRKKVHLGASMFLGDVFKYLRNQGDYNNPGPIVKTVLTSFQTARRHVSMEDPKLIIVGHSLGGVISYDILTYFDPTIQVDVFVTVGSQVALFEEMTLYKASRPELPANPPSERLARPANIKEWLNVLDTNDVFSFRAGGVFEGVTDYLYHTGSGLLTAHNSYFSQTKFYRRLGEHLAQP
jgi:hypothetical protein